MRDETLFLRKKKGFGTFGLVRLENLALRPRASVHVPFGAQFGLVRPRNLAVRPWACVHVLVRARLGQCAPKT